MALPKEVTDRIKKDAEEAYPILHDTSNSSSNANKKRSAYITGAEKEAQRNSFQDKNLREIVKAASKIDAIGFGKFIVINLYMSAWEGVWYKNFGTPKYESHTTEQLYELYKSQQ